MTGRCLAVTDSLSFDRELSDAAFLVLALSLGYTERDPSIREVLRRLPLNLRQIVAARKEIEAKGYGRYCHYHPTKAGDGSHREQPSRLTSVRPDADPDRSRYVTLVPVRAIEGLRGKGAPQAVRLLVLYAREQLRAGAIQMRHDVAAWRLGRSPKEIRRAEARLLATETIRVEKERTGRYAPAIYAMPGAGEWQKPYHREHDPERTRFLFEEELGPHCFHLYATRRELRAFRRIAEAARAEGLGELQIAAAFGAADGGVIEARGALETELAKRLRAEYERNHVPTFHEHFGTPEEADRKHAYRAKAQTPAGDAQSPKGHIEQHQPTEGFSAITEVRLGHHRSPFGPSPKAVLAIASKLLTSETLTTTSSSPNGLETADKPPSDFQDERGQATSAEQSGNDDGSTEATGKVEGTGDAEEEDFWVGEESGGQRDAADPPETRSSELIADTDEIALAVDEVLAAHPGEHERPRVVRPLSPSVREIRVGL